MVAALRTITPVQNYRTVSDEAFLIAGLPSVDLIAGERSRIKIRLFEDPHPGTPPLLKNI